MLRPFLKIMMVAVMLMSGVATTFAADATSQKSQTEFLPAIVLDAGGKHDNSFGQAAYNGMERFKKETGINYLEATIQTDPQREQFMRKMIQKGATMVIVVGFNFKTPLSKVAPEFPNVKFVIIDEEVDLPNVMSVKFKEHEGSFLVGMMAAMATKTNKVGFIGGMDIPLIHKFALGFKEGVHHVNPKIEVIENMVGNTPAAWTDPTKGNELARSQIDRGVDVIYGAAGKTNDGILQAAADAKVLAIGVDSNQNAMQSGSVLTSMVKRVDVAICDALAQSRDGKFKTGLSTLGLAEGGIEYSLDEHNKNLVNPEMLKAVEDAKQAIIKGDIKVTDYTQQQSNKK